MANTTFYNHPLHQGLTVTVEPTSEPVTLAEAKAWLRQEIDDDDDLISGLIVAARKYAETFQRRQLMPATYRLVLDQFPVASYSFQSYTGPAIVVPMPKLVSVTSIAYTDQSGNSQTLSNTRYSVDTDSQPGRITPVYAMPWPVVRPQAASVVVTYVAGYANAAAVPQATKTAIKMLVEHWYRNRSAVGSVGATIELAVASLLSCDSLGSYA